MIISYPYRYEITAPFFNPISMDKGCYENEILFIRTGHTFHFTIEQDMILFIMRWR